MSIMKKQLTGLRYFPKKGKGLVFLSPSVHAMFTIVNDYLTQYDSEELPDRPYFYNERATLSLLAGGIWKSDQSNLVLEEYCSPKVGESGNYRGRFDVWFRTADKSCSCEAKQIYT